MVNKNALQHSDQILARLDMVPAEYTDEVELIVAKRVSSFERNPFLWISGLVSFGMLLGSGAILAFVR
jgi:hypothetical protein